MRPVGRQGARVGAAGGRRLPRVCARPRGPSGEESRPLTRVSVCDADAHAHGQQRVTAGRRFLMTRLGVSAFTRVEKNALNTMGE